MVVRATITFGIVNHNAALQGSIVGLDWVFAKDRRGKEAQVRWLTRLLVDRKETVTQTNSFPCIGQCSEAGWLGNGREKEVFQASRGGAVGCP